MGNLVNSKPCNTCIYYMQLYGIKSVYYSNEDGEIVKEKLNDITADHLSISQNKYYKYIENGKDRYIFDYGKEKEKIGKK
jgi:deoxycytidylate deaminase